MKITISYQEDKSALAERVLTVLRRIMPGCRVKSKTKEENGRSYYYVTPK